MEVVIGSVGAVLVVVLVIAFASRQPRSQNSVASGHAPSVAKDEGVLLI